MCRNQTKRGSSGAVAPRATSSVSSSARRGRCEAPEMPRVEERCGVKVLYRGQRLWSSRCVRLDVAETAVRRSPRAGRPSPLPPRPELHLLSLSFQEEEASSQMESPGWGESRGCGQEDLGAPRRDLKGAVWRVGTTGVGQTWKWLLVLTHGLGPTMGLASRCRGQGPALGSGRPEVLVLGHLPMAALGPVACQMGTRIPTLPGSPIKGENVQEL